MKKVESIKIDEYGWLMLIQWLLGYVEQLGAEHKI